MKPFLCLLMLVTCIKGALYAQQMPSKKTFGLPGNYINRRFYFELHQGNEIQLGLKSLKDLDAIGDLDSLIRVCLRDLAPFKDTLADELASKKIDYSIDASGRKEVRIQQTLPTGSSFLLQTDGMAALKLEQDTLHILAPVNGSAASSGSGEPHRFEVTILVNGIAELPRIMGADIKGKVEMLRRSMDGQETKTAWHWDAGPNRRLHLKQDPDISEGYEDGGVVRGGDRVQGVITTNLQNYKSYFVPSFSLGLDFVFNSSRDILPRPSAYEYEIGLNWEPQFFFQNTQGKLQTYRNDFLTLTLGRFIKEKRASPLVNDIHFFFPGRLTLSYLINRNGSFYEKNTFRLGTGGVTLFKEKFKLEPVIYFNNFFKGVTPGVRLQVAF